MWGHPCVPLTWRSTCWKGPSETVTSGFHISRAGKPRPEKERALASAPEQRGGRAVARAKVFSSEARAG